MMGCLTAVKVNASTCMHHKNMLSGNKKGYRTICTILQHLQRISNIQNKPKIT